MKRLAKALVVARIKENQKTKPHTWDHRKAGPWDRKTKKADGGPVTDPDILAQLNADSEPKPVTDPDILAQLNGSSEPHTKDFSWSQAITDIPNEIGNDASAAASTIKQGLFTAPEPGISGGLKNVKDTARGLAAIPQLIASPITGAYHSLIGHGMANAEHAVGSLINPEQAAKDDPSAMYNTAKGDVDTAMMAARTSPIKAPAVTTPPPAMPVDPMGVTLSEGQTTGNMAALRNEQAALKGQLGPAAEQQAQAFKTQQAGQVDQATEDVTKALDPAGNQILSDSPQNAGEIASNAVQKEAARAKANVDKAYTDARSMPGEIHADVFRDMGNGLKTDLSNLDEPVIIDDKLTPHASKMIDDLDDRISKLRIQNKAQPQSTALAGASDDSQVVGVNLKGVDQMRRRLSTMRGDALRSGNGADARAANAVLDAFDQRVDAGINGGQFNGDPSAIKAWNAARAAYSDYKNTFGKGKNDPVGRVVEKILGTRNNPAAIPNDVADFMYGSSGTNPSSLNVGVANRIKGILGDQSPEWAAIRQGLFQKLTDAGQGVSDFGSGKIAQRLNKFLNNDGRELAESVFTEPQRQLLQQYADLHRKLEVPKGAFNSSDTATFMSPVLKKIRAGIESMIGAAIGNSIAPGAHGIGAAIGAAAGNKASGLIEGAKNARMIANQMPLVGDRLRAWQKAVQLHARGGYDPSLPALATASKNLAAALNKLGLNAETIGLLQGPVPAGAQNKQQ